MVAVRIAHIRFDNFLLEAERAALLADVAAWETSFVPSGVTNPVAGRGEIAPSRRRSLVRMDVGAHHAVIRERVRAVLPRVLATAGFPTFRVTGMETQLTASGDGAFFARHRDQTTANPQREITFVYYFHRQPKAFAGGDLRLYPITPLDGVPIMDEFLDIAPADNSIVFFPSIAPHEVLPVTSSAAFADSRFTLNGWLRR